MSGWQGIAQHSRHMKVLPKPWRFRRRGILTKGTLKVRKVLVIRWRRCSGFVRPFSARHGGGQPPPALSEAQRRRKS